MPCFRVLWKTVFVKGDIVYYESSDFLETADSDTLKQIVFDIDGKRTVNVKAIH